MKKQKILFYGNCQTGAISGIFQSYPSLKDKFTVLDAEDYNLINQNYPAVANFLLREDTPNGKNDPRDIEKIFSDADIVVFQAIDNHTVPEYCLTKNIIPNFDGLSICIPSFWYGGYFGWPYKFPMLDIFYYLNQLNLSDKEALNVLLNESIPITNELFTYYHDVSLKGLSDRAEEQSKLYNNYISMKNWLLDTYKNKLLCYNHSHPAPTFFEFIVNEILNRIDSSMEDVNLENFDFQHALADGWFQPTTFKFFNNLFPNLKPLSKIEVAHYHNVYKENELERFFNEGMKYVKDNKVINGHQLMSAPEVKNILGIKD